MSGLLATDTALALALWAVRPGVLVHKHPIKLTATPTDRPPTIELDVRTAPGPTHPDDAGRPPSTSSARDARMAASEDMPDSSWKWDDNESVVGEEDPGSALELQVQQPRRGPGTA